MKGIALKGFFTQLGKIKPNEEVYFDGKQALDPYGYIDIKTKDGELATIPKQVVRIVEPETVEDVMVLEKLAEELSAHKKLIVFPLFEKTRAGLYLFDDELPGILAVADMNPPRKRSPMNERALFVNLLPKIALEEQIELFIAEHKNGLYKLFRVTGVKDDGTLGREFLFSDLKPINLFKRFVGE